MRAALLVLLLLSSGVALLQAVRGGWIDVPDRWNPWAPLIIDAPPGWLTRFKLMRLSGNDDLCLAVLAQADMRYQRLPDRQTGEHCGFHNAVRISATSAHIKTPFALSCRAAVSLAMWERHVVQPAARRRFGAPVAQLEHFGSYACRNVNNREGGRRSQHATADALDVAGFILADGHTIRVAQNWKPVEAADDDARFLHEIHDGACPFFSTVLGPGYNAAHRDHLHLDRGPFGICR